LLSFSAILFVLFFSYYALLINRSITDLQRFCSALFLSLITVIYAPQISSLIFATLNIWVLLAVSFASPLFLSLTQRKNLPRAWIKTCLASYLGLGGGFARELLRSWYTTALAALSIFAMGFASWLLANFSNFGWDGWAYHSAAIAWFSQQDRITASMPLMEWIATYPKNLEFLSLWIEKLTGNDQFIEAGNLIVHLFVIPFAYGVGRYCNLNKHWAAATCLVYFLTPEIISQSWSTLIDGAFADSLVMLLFLSFSWHSSNRDNQLFWSVLLGLGLGHVMHSKGLGLYVTAILGCLLLARVVIEKDTRRLGTRLLIMTTFAALSGAGWYLKNWHVYGNPVYPFEVALPGMDIILFSGKNLKMLVEPSGSGNYRDSSLLWVYLSQFAGTSYQPGWGSHFFFLGLPAMVATIFRNRNLTWLVLFTIAYFVVIPFSFESRYSLVPCLAGSVAFGYMSQEILDTKGWQRALQGVSLVTITLSLLAALSIFGDQNKNISHADFSWREGLKRFALVREKPGARVAIVNLGFGADNPYWYFYFGPKWENKVEIFDPQDVSTYDYVVCDFSEMNCPSLSSHSLALLEQTVAVYRKNG
jgi:Dolichyl-phosphate-mannose-protein mannosyltransferase